MTKKQKEAGKKVHQIALRLDDDQLARLNRVFERGEERTLGEADHSVMLRELLELIPWKILNEEDRLLLKPDGLAIEVKKNERVSGGANGANKSPPARTGASWTSMTSGKHGVPIGPLPRTY